MIWAANLSQSGLELSYGLHPHLPLRGSKPVPSVDENPLFEGVVVTICWKFCVIVKIYLEISARAAKSNPATNHLAGCAKHRNAPSELIKLTFARMADTSEVR